MTTAAKIQFIKGPAHHRAKADTNVTVERLTENERQEAIEFLAVRPLHTVILSGWIRDNGILSPLNRGAFYGCRDTGNKLVGLALVGRNTLFEARTDEAIKAFAKCVRLCPDVRMVFAEEAKLSKFWRHYAGAGQTPRSSCSELLMSNRAAKEIDNTVDLRIATQDNLDQIVSAHAGMVFAETGVDPLVTDAEGFRMRCARRVEQGRVWVWIRNGELIFKTDIISVTPEAIYFEGLWVNPVQRGKGYSRRCLTSLCQQLLTGTNTICGFVDEGHSVARSLYLKSGFAATDRYAKIYI